MKLFLAVLFATSALAVADNTDIDWSTVKPLWQIKEWQDMFPAKMAMIRERGLLDNPKTFQFPSGRIAGGLEAERHQFPYQVGVVTHLASGNGFCGGSLVSRNYVMTAAHCLQPAASAISVLGAHNVFTQTESTQQRIFGDSSTFRIHPSFSSETNQADLAVIRLTTPANYGDYIRSVRLPNWRQVDLTFAGQLGVVSGWGRTQNWNNDLSTYLQFARLPIITNLACRTRFPTSTITDDQICAGGDVGGPCDGDMGGPLSVVEADGRTTQVGVVSFGFAFGCEASWASVYLRTTSFLQWIEESTDGSISENWN